MLKAALALTPKHGKCSDVPTQVFRRSGDGLADQAAHYPVCKVEGPFTRGLVLALLITAGALLTLYFTYLRRLKQKPTERG
jgi:hypothetical protein